MTASSQVSYTVISDTTNYLVLQFSESYCSSLSLCTYNTILSYTIGGGQNPGTSKPPSNSF